MTAPSRTDIAPASAPSTASQKIIVALSAFAGVQIWILFTAGLTGSKYAVWACFVATVLAMIPAVGRHWLNVVDCCRRATPVQIRWITAAVAVTIFIYLLTMAFVQHRWFAPQWHDENAYVIQARQLATGRLWLPAHELPEFFESFLVIASPVYASTYFPGTALLFAAGMIVGVPTWIVALIVTSLAAAVLYRLAVEFAGAFNGLLAPLVFIAVDQVRQFSVQSLSQPPMMLLGPLMVLLLLRWRVKPTAWRAAALGATTGLALIVRPFDAIAFAVPIGVAILWDSRKLGRRGIITTLVAGSIGALPFLTLQVIQNYGMTGHFTQVARTLDIPRNYPQFNPSFEPYDPAVRPTSDRQQAQDLYDSLCAPAKKAYSTRYMLTTALRYRINAIFASPSYSIAMPLGMLLILVPVGVIAAIRSRAWIVPVLIPSFLATYLPLALFMPHYAVVMTIPMILLTMLGKQTLETAWPKLAAPISAGLTALLIFTCVGDLPIVNRVVSDQFFELHELRPIVEAINAVPENAALVFVKYQSGDLPDAEAVYNTATAAIDDGRVVIAHDRDAEDINLIRYYARIGQDRAVYRYVRTTKTMTYLGTTRNLAQSGL